MKQNASWRALARAGLMTAASILAGSAYAEPARKPALRGAIAPLPAASVQPAAGANLKFFTIAQRVAVLRAAGRLPELDESSERPAIVQASLVIETPEPEQRPATRIPNLLGMAVLPVPGGELAAKWQEMAARWETEKATIEGCRGGPCNHPGAARWLEIEAAAGKLSGAEQLSHVHGRINRSISYASDLAAQSAADHWASPLEVIEKVGDCEDYAIAKYMMLRSLGRSAEDLKLVVLFQPWSGMYHAILAVRSGESWTYLDNQRAELTGEGDYRGVRAIATLDETGQALLAALPKVLAPSAAPMSPTPLRDAVY
jgi:predicted transglutaminase-like cysteine proteinase